MSQTQTFEATLFVPKDATRDEWSLYHAYRRIRHQETRPEDPLNPDDLVEKSMKREDPFSEQRQFVVVADGDMVSSFGAGVAKPDSPGYESNKQYIWAGGGVTTGYRRRGIGTMWVRKTLELMEEWDKTVCTFWWVEEEDGHAFMKWLGAGQKQTFAENRLDFSQIDWEKIERWVKEGKEKASDIELRMYENRVPEDVFETYAPVLSELLMTMPFDDMDHGDIVVTPETLREGQARWDELGTEVHTLTAWTTDGRLVGMTDVGWNPAKPTYVNQRFTGVHPDARGRGLGKLLKAYMVDFLRKRYQGLEWVVTGNAHSNAPMLKINIEMGFKEHKGAGTYQITREELESHVAGLS